MVVQLPSQVLGAAVGVLFYSTVCLLCSCLMIWLVWTHHERDSYVALLSYFTLLSTAASIAQQIHTLLWWMDIKVEQYEHVVANIGKPEIAIAGPSAGVDLVLFYIQYYSYNVEAMLTLFWACALCQSVFHVANTDILKRMKYKGHLFAKGVAIAVPVLLLSLLRLDVVQKSLPAFLVLANLNIIMSLPLGCIILLVILLKYIHTKRQLLSWHVRYPNRREPDEPEQGRICGPEGLEQYQGIYDRWLVLRFTIAFVVLGVFQVTTILSEVGQWENHTREALGDEADLSTARATKDFIFFIPGVSISLLVFIVFGTTRTFRQKLYNTFVPKMFRSPVPSAETAMPIGNTLRGANNAAPEPTDWLDHELEAHIKQMNSMAQARIPGYSSPLVRRD